jgi:ABC-2 type transport system permease protein/sodium transport system permease protein
MASSPQTGPTRAYSRESLFRLGRLVRKELLEIFRDRRTIITLVLMPLLLYPLLSVAFQQFFLASSIDPNRGLTYRIGFARKQEYRTFFHFLAFGEQIVEAQAKEGASKEDKKDSAARRPELVPKIFTDLEKALRDGEVDLAVHVKNADQFHLPLKNDMVLDGNIQFLSNNPTALGALTWVERRLGAVLERNLETRLDLPLVQPKVALLHVTRTALAVAGTDSIVSLAALVPLILILMTITGAVYPAIDLTAGERERGTLEILVAAPVPRLGLLFAKYVSVFAVAVLTAFVNLVTMVLTLIFSGLSQVLFASGSLSLLLVLQLFCLLLLFAAFFSAVLLSLTSFARSFKEAQAYLIPLMLASLGPGLIGMIPGLELEGPLAAAPLVNIVLLARDLVKGGADPAWALVVILTTLAYAAAAIAVAARIFGAEGVLYNEQSGWTDLLRRPGQPREVATVSAALWCLALMIPSHFVLQWLVRLPTPSLPHVWQYLALGLVGVALFGLLPALSAYMGRVRLRSGFGLTPAPPAALLGALILGFSLWPMLFQILIVLFRDRFDQLKTLLGSQLEELQRDREILIAVLVIQALLEELFFRGYLFAALRRQLSAMASITITAALFGLLHVVMGGALGWERLLPSTLLGLVLGWVRSTSGSVLPGMLLHAVHNAILNLVPPTQELPWGWLAAGAAGSCLGTALVAASGRGWRPGAKPVSGEQPSPAVRP